MATEIPDNAYAITWSEEEGFSLLMPKDENGEVPAQGVALVGLFMKLQDEEYVVQQVSDIEEKMSCDTPASE